VLRLGVYGGAYRDKKVVGVFVRFSLRRFTSGVAYRTANRLYFNRTN
jgi:hypothetical protein